MDIIQITKEIVNHQERNGQEWVMLKEKLFSLIDTTGDLELIKSTLEIDVNDLIPFELKKKMFEKLIEISRTKLNLETFAWWLQLNGGPESDEYAEKLLGEANLLNNDK